MIPETIAAIQASTAVCQPVDGSEETRSFCGMQGQNILPPEKAPIVGTRNIVGHVCCAVQSVPRVPVCVSLPKYSVPTADGFKSTLRADSLKNEYSAGSVASHRALMLVFHADTRDSAAASVSLSFVPVD